MQLVFRYLRSFFILLIGVSFVLLYLACAATGIVLLYWFFGNGGWLAILQTLVTTAETGFQHDWKLSEVVLVLLVVFLVVRKR